MRDKAAGACVKVVYYFRIMLGLSVDDIVLCLRAFWNED